MQISDYFVNSLEIKKIKENQYLLYNYGTKKSYLIDKKVFDILIIALQHMTIKGFINEIKQKFPKHETHKIVRFLFKEKILLINASRRYLTKYFKLKVKVPLYLWILILIIYLIVVIFGLRIFLVHPLQPHELYIVGGFFYLVVFYFSWVILTLFHEFSHVFFASLFDCESRIYFKIYFLFPAIVTETPKVILLDRKKRLLVHSGGIIMDFFLLNLFLVLSEFLYPTIFRFFATIKLLTLFSQLHIHLKTDFYFIVEDILNAINLKKESIDYFIKRKKPSFNKKWEVIVFFFIVILGYSLNIFFILSYIIPGMLFYYRKSLESKMVIWSFLVISLSAKIFKFLKKLKKPTLKK